jgi:hypothetical protein
MFFDLIRVEDKINYHSFLILVITSNDFLRFLVKMNDASPLLPHEKQNTQNYLSKHIFVLSLFCLF